MFKISCELEDGSIVLLPYKFDTRKKAANLAITLEERTGLKHWTVQNAFV